MYKISPADITKQAFRKVLRGYDPVEVDTFLEMVAEEYGRLIERNAEIEKNFSGHQQQVSDLEQRKAELEQALESVNEPKSAPAARTEEKPAGAEREAKAITEEARRELKQIQDEIAVLREKRSKFIRMLKKELRAQIELLKVFEADTSEAKKAAPGDRKRRPGTLRERPEKPEPPEKKRTPQRPAGRMESVPPPAENEAEKPPVQQEILPKRTPDEENRQLSPGLFSRDEPEEINGEQAGEEVTPSKIHDGFSLIDGIIDEDDETPDEDENDDNR